MPPESYVDVLIIGAGPAGLMCANALAVAGVDVKIIDKRPTKVMAGHADGVMPRTLEVLESYGLSERLFREGNQIHMVAFYQPGRNGGIECATRSPAVNTPAARHPFIITQHQGEVESIFINSLKVNGLDMDMERPKQPSSIEISDSVYASYPVKVMVENLDMIDEMKKIETIHAKFVIGADGAHSWVRKTLGIEMQGEQTEYIWGVLDTILETDFPDNRNASYINSEYGSCVNIPREGNRTRLYVQLSDKDIVDPLTERVDKNRMNPDKLIALARKMLHPYELTDLKDIEWWTVYTIGQRVASSYSFKDRVFIVGDACHTHSPKAGQGMNAGINDAHNLSWKLVHVLKGWSRPSILETYEHERRRFALDLINFDKEFAALVSGQLKAAQAENANDVSVSPNDSVVAQAFRKQDALISGFGVHYSPSAIIDIKHQKCAEGLVIGQTMLPQIFVRAADSRPMEIQDLLPADIRFKILFFVGMLTSDRIGELHVLAELNNPLAGILRKYSVDGDIFTVFDIITIIAGKKCDMNFLRLPILLRSKPHWNKVLLDDTDTRGKCGGGAYERFKMDLAEVTLVVVRPDGYVGTIVPSTAVADLDGYFGSFMVPRNVREDHRPQVLSYL